jgi:hypothetical protein
VVIGSLLFVVLVVGFFVCKCLLAGSILGCCWWVLLGGVGLCIGTVCVKVVVEVVEVDFLLRAFVRLGLGSKRVIFVQGLLEH